MINIFAKVALIIARNIFPNRAKEIEEEGLKKAVANANNEFEKYNDELKQEINKAIFKKRIEEDRISQKEHPELWEEKITYTPEIKLANGLFVGGESKILVRKKSV